MKNQRTKKATVGERIAAKAFDPEHYDISTLSRRIDRAIAAAVRKERNRCVQCVRAYGLADTDFGAAAIARMEHRSNP